MCKESSETTESRTSRVRDPLDGLTRQRLASKRALGDSLGSHTHTHTNLKGEPTLFLWYGVCVYALSSLGIIKVL